MIAVTLLVISMFALGFGFAIWQLLPLELLEIEDSYDRFIAWEGVMWGIGLILVFFGVAGALAGRTYTPSGPLTTSGCR